MKTHAPFGRRDGYQPLSAAEMDTKQTPLNIRFIINLVIPLGRIDFTLPCSIRVRGGGVVVVILIRDVRYTIEKRTKTSFATKIQLKATQR